MKRYGWVIGLHPEKVNDYKELHATVWPGVLSMIKTCNIHNYSIFLRQLPNGEHLLFSYLEYAGNDFAMDMQKMAADPETQRWWAVCIPCQLPLENRLPGEWWADMEEVFHLW